MSTNRLHIIGISIHRVWFRFFTIVALIFLAGCSSVATPEVVIESSPQEGLSPNVPPVSELIAGDFEHSITVSGIERIYSLHVPSGVDASMPLPVVFVFHDYTKAIATLRFQSKFDDISDANNFMVVYPHGIGASWNGGGCCGIAVEDNLDDVEFVNQILIELRKTFTLDAQRIYTAGFSNGGMMAYRLGCEMSETFAAVAAVEGVLFYDQCEPKNAVSLIHFHGLADPFVPYAGGNGIEEASLYDFPPVETGIEKWEQWSGCSNLPQVSMQGLITHTVYSDCKNNTAVELYTFEGMEHAWPQPKGSGHLNFPATQTIWDFFVAHPKSSDL